MSNFLKALIALAILVPPVMFFINWKVDNAVSKAVAESKITQPIQVGELYAGKCALCHGANADGSDSYPRLNKLSKDELIQKLKNHKNASGTSPIMKMQAGSLTDMQIEVLAGFISTLKPAENTKADGASAAKKDALKLDNSGGKD